MKLWTEDDLGSKSDSFEVVETTERSQFAVMVLKPGQSSGSFGNEHAESDQWLLVLEGQGKVRAESGEARLNAGDLVLIPAPEKHQFLADADEELRAVTFYSPAAYRLGN